MAATGTLASLQSNHGLTTLINAGGANTEHSGSRMRPEALQAIEEAAQVFVAIPDLLDAAGQLIANAIDPSGSIVEAAAVCAGASAGMALMSAGVALQPERACVCSTLLLGAVYVLLEI